MILFRRSTAIFLHLGHRGGRWLLLIAHELLLEGVLPLLFDHMIALLLHGAGAADHCTASKAQRRFAVWRLSRAAPTHHLPCLRGAVLLMLLEDCARSSILQKVSIVVAQLADSFIGEEDLASVAAGPHRVVLVLQCICNAF